LDFDLYEKGFMKRYLIIILWVCVACHITAQVEDAFKNVWSIDNQASNRSLNGIWKFTLIHDTNWSQYQDFYKTSYNDSLWSTIPVPGNWDIYGFTTPHYDYPGVLTGFYRHIFTVPSKWNGQHVMLRLDGVLRAYDLWINGQYVGKWESAFNTCQFDITPYLNSKGRNLLAMRVYTIYKGNSFDCNDDWAQVGISRDVTLYPVPTVHISDVTIKTVSLKRKTAIVSFNFDISSFKDKKIKDGNLFIKANLVDYKGKIKSFFCLPVISGKLYKEIIFTNPLLWTAETPMLYQIKYSLCQGKQILESSSEHFGIRQVEIKGTSLKLNGIAIKLRGVTLHATDPKNGKVISENLNLKDMRLMKAANVNCIRTSHYPREPRFYELCDSLGFYVIDEVPFGYGDELLSDTTYQDILLTRARSTVQRDKNHPSVIVWSIGNENPLTQITIVTGKYVQKMDPSRPICYPMMGGYFSNLHFNIPDFVDIYAPHYPDIDTINEYAKISKKPIIYTEYSHSLGQAFEQHHETWEAIENNECMAGGCVWEWVDQGMPFKAHRTDFYQWTDSVWLDKDGGFMMDGYEGTDGLLYANRIPLSNYYVLQSDYAQAQVLDTTLILTPGEHKVPIHIRNRYDFINLCENIRCDWTLFADHEAIQKGHFTPNCQPHANNLIYINLSIPKNDGRIYWLKFSMIDKKNKDCIYNQQVVRVNKFPNLVKRLALSNAVEKGNALSLFQKGPLVRVGRKTSLSEDFQVKDRVIKNYLMEPKLIKGQNYLFENDSISLKGTIDYTSENNATKVSFNLKPIKSKKLLLESGIAFLLDSSICNVQWYGNGPFASYPGKTSSNNYGFYSKSKGDLYFEGNRIGVDAVLCTKSNGDGIVLLCNNANVNFEQTDRGIVLTYNVYVSGLGAKWGITNFPIFANQIDSLKGSFYLFKINGKHWDKIMHQLFVPCNDIKAFHPFMSQYDNYLLKYDDIIGK